MRVVTHHPKTTDLANKSFLRKEEKKNRKNVLWLFFSSFFFKHQKLDEIWLFIDEGNKAGYGNDF